MTQRFIPTSPRFSLILWCIALLAYALFLGKFAVPYLEKGATDLPSLYLGAERSIRGLSPYDAVALADIGAAVQQDIYPFIYPPPSLLLLAPLTLLSYSEAHLFILIFNHLLILVITFQLAGLLRAQGAPRIATPLLLLYISLSFPVAQTIHHGQLNFALLALLLSALGSGATKRGEMRAGVVVAIAALVKPHLGLLFVPLTMCRGKRPLVSGCITGISAIFATAMLLPAATWPAWWSLTSRLASFTEGPSILPSLGGLRNQSLPWTVYRFFVETPWSTPLISAPSLGQLSIVIIPGALFIVALFATWRIGPRESLSSGCSRWLITALLISPATWEHHFVFALVALIPLASEFARQPLSAVNLLSLFAFLVLGAPSIETNFAQQALPAELFIQSFRILAVLWLWTALHINAWRTSPKNVSFSG